MKFSVKVNATSANIGAGFDCIGAALELKNEVIVSDECDSPLEIIASGGVPRDESNLVYRSMIKTFDAVGYRVGHLKIEQTDRIPMASGLGSSAACIVAGVCAANALSGFSLSERDTAALCASIDGHPDNVLPALLGGVTAGVMLDGGVEYIRADIGKELSAVALTPDFPLLTEKSRRVLPQSYSREDVIFSLSRAVLTFAALALGQSDKLGCLDDRLHQPYRIPLIKGYREAKQALKDAGALCVYLSGAGPTLIGIFNSSAGKGSVSAPDGWTVRRLPFSDNPVLIEKL
ncbi:MAG: homoserine kinase [Christensenellales bacterium]